jgi:phospholipid/cholesterol/gamma-HCH transport system substrate-binding protein
LGEQYVELNPGAEEEVLADGDVIGLTQSAFVLEELIGRVLLNRAEGG